jgi:hypothetical protein
MVKTFSLIGLNLFFRTPPSNAAKVGKLSTVASFLLSGNFSAST